MSGPKPETPIVKRALEHLHAQMGGLWWRANSGSGGKKNGKHKCNSINLPDICGHLRWGVSGFVEVKTREGRLTDEQHKFLVAREAAKCWVRVYVEDTFYVLDKVPDANMPRGK